MNVVIAEPPMMDEIDRVFCVRGKAVVFTWGGTIYNPKDVFLRPEILAHEGAHYARQGKDETKIRQWWERYLVDADFRLAEELPAHRAEYHALCQINGRHNRSLALHHVAMKLSAPLYGKMITPRQARTMIMNGRIA